MAVSLSASGTRVAIGAPYFKPVSGTVGNVRVFEYQVNSWVQVGSDINGEAFLDYFGWSVSLSADGNRVAAGATQNDGSGNNAGHVRVHDFDSGSWVQVGGDIDGEAADDKSGYAVSLSDDGNRLAIGAGENDGTAANAGHVRIFQLENANWTQLGPDIDGEAATDFSGRVLAMSADGTKVGIGASGNDQNGLSSGHARVYGVIVDPTGAPTPHPTSFPTSSIPTSMPASTGR